jgi:hypothetical protein
VEHALRPHRIVVGQLVRNLGQMVSFVNVLYAKSLSRESWIVLCLFVEEMVGQMVEHHGILGLEVVGDAQRLDSTPNALRRARIQVEDGNRNYGRHIGLVHLQGTLEGQSSNKEHTVK